jgi:hypothetical protein
MSPLPGIGGVARGLLAVVVAVAIGVAVAASRGSREDDRPVSPTATPTPAGTRVPQEASPRSTPEGGEADRDGR